MIPRVLSKARRPPYSLRRKDEHRWGSATAGYDRFSISTGWMSPAGLKPKTRP